MFFEWMNEMPIVVSDNEKKENIVSSAIEEAKIAIARKLLGI